MEQEQCWTMKIRPHEKLWHIDLGEIWRYRDLTILFSFIVQLWMYATPIVYPISMVEEGTLRTLIMVNPMTSIIEAFKYATLGQGYFS